MSKQPEALRLADVVVTDWATGIPAWAHDTSRELRRLHSINAELLEALQSKRTELLCRDWRALSANGRTSEMRALAIDSLNLFEDLHAAIRRATEEA